MCYVAITLIVRYYCVMCVDFSTLWAVGVVDCVDLSNFADLSGDGFLRQVPNRTYNMYSFCYIFFNPPILVLGEENEK